MSLRPPSAGLALSFAAALWAAGAPTAAGWARAATSVPGPTPGPAPLTSSGAPPATRHAEGGDDVAGGAATTAASGPSRAPRATGTPVSTGRIAGLVRLTTAARREPRTDAYAPRAVRVSSREAVPEVTHVVVFLTGVPPQANLPAMHAVVRQRDESFEPRVVAVTRGSTVDFPNDDPFFHNVFSLSRAASFDLGRYARGHSRSRVFPKAGLVKLFCDLHVYMSAVIFVFDHPWFAVPDATGRFLLDEVPAGRHTLKAWHERIGDAEVTVVVEPGRTSDVELVLPVLES